MDCCEDPIVFQKMTLDLKDWIEKNAPGTSDGACERKESHSKIIPYII